MVNTTQTEIPVKYSHYRHSFIERNVENDLFWLEERGENLISLIMV